MESPITPATAAVPTAPMSRLQAIVALRQTLKALLPNLGNPEARRVAAAALQETSHVLAPPRPSQFGWAIRPTKNSMAPWVLEFDAARAEMCRVALDAAGVPTFEVLSLSATPALLTTATLADPLDASS